MTANSGFALVAVGHLQTRKWNGLPVNTPNRRASIYRARYHVDDIIQIGRVLSCPARLRVYSMLGERGRAVGEVARMARLSQAATSYHLARLAEVGLVEAHRRGRRTIYRQGPLLYSIAVERVAESA